MAEANAREARQASRQTPPRQLVSCGRTGDRFGGLVETQNVDEDEAAKNAAISCLLTYVSGYHEEADTKSTNSNRTRRQFGRPRRGFTLIEVMAAMLLMTMLFVAMTSLLRSFADQKRRLEEWSAAHPKTQQLSGLIRRDLTNARFVRSEPRSLTLIGNLGRSSTSHATTGRLAEVTYRIDSIDGQPWLMRREVQLDNLSTQRSREELVWRGATTIRFVPTTFATTDNDSLNSNTTNQTTPTNAPIGMDPMPSRMKLIIQTEDNRTLVDLNLVHHWEDN